MLTFFDLILDATLKLLLRSFVLPFPRTCVLDPGAFRTVSEIVSSKSKGQGVLEITSVTTVETSDATLD